MRIIFCTLFLILLIFPISQSHADIKNVSTQVHIGRLIKVSFTYPDIVDTPSTKIISIPVSVTIEALKKVYVKYLVIAFYYPGSHGYVHEAGKYLLIKDTNIFSDWPIQIQYTINVYDGEGPLIAEILFTGGRRGLWYPDEDEAIFRYEYQDYIVCVFLTHIHSDRYRKYDILLTEYNNLLDDYNDIYENYTALNTKYLTLEGRYNALYKDFIKLYEKYREDILVLSTSTTVLVIIMLLIGRETRS